MITIIFETEDGEEFARADITPAEYKYLEQAAEKENISFEEYLNKAIMKNLPKLDEAGELDD